jgi:hypothetical protein
MCPRGQPHRAHDGLRRDGDERAGPGLGVHGAPAGRRAILIPEFRSLRHSGEPVGSGQVDSRVHRLRQGQSPQTQHGVGGHRHQGHIAGELFKMMAAIPKDGHPRNARRDLLK